MIQKISAIIFLISLFVLEDYGQIFPKEYWKEIADASKLIVIGTVEDRHQAVRAEKLLRKSDGTFPNHPKEYSVGRVFRVKITKNLKGKAIAESENRSEYISVFLFWISGIPAMGDPVLLENKEYLLFLEPNKKEDLKGIGLLEFTSNNEMLINPFDYKSSYLVVHGFRGAVEIKTNKKKLIKEIKKAI